MYRLDHTYPDRLVQLALKHGFDGWFVNLESRVPSSIHACLMIQQLHYFKTILEGHGLALCIYDAMTSSGRIKWQNQVNAQNKSFFDASHSFFLNYWWNASKLESSLSFTDNPAKIHVGIDIFGRGTYGGGGFNAHLALKEITKLNMSVGLFAPGWVLEEFGQESFEACQTRFWTDSSSYSTRHIPDHAISLNPDADHRLIKLDNVGCIADYIQARSVPLVDNGFYTRFEKGSGQLYFVDGLVSSKPWFHLSRQTPQPTFSHLMYIVEHNQLLTVPLNKLDLDSRTRESFEGKVVFVTKDNGLTALNGGSVLRVPFIVDPDGPMDFGIPLFEVNLELQPTHTIDFTYQLSTPSDNLVLGCVATFEIDNDEDKESLTVVQYSRGTLNKHGWLDWNWNIGETYTGFELKTLGLTWSLSFQNEVLVNESFDLQRQRERVEQCLAYLSSSKSTISGILVVDSFRLSPLKPEVKDVSLNFDWTIQEDTWILDWEKATRDIHSLEEHHVFINKEFIGITYTTHYWLPNSQLTSTKVQVLIKIYNTHGHLVLQITSK